ncbi:glycosyltransferase family 39 protein [Candidatus Saccharibacteria bacterium]|nr:glycosyltransferase family 39 protein [Candidatus Saccharibacteria bacterium]
MKKFFEERKRFIFLVSPAIIGAVFLFLCFSNFGPSVNYQESANAFMTRSDFSAVWNSSISQAQPPLYFLALKTWAHFFGHSVIIMRALSAIMGALAIIFAFLWLKYKYGSTIAIVSSFMMAISPALVHFGQSIAPYTMLIAIFFAATFFLQLAIDDKKTAWWVIYVLLLIAGMLTSYFSLFAWLAHFVYLATIYRHKIFQHKFVYIYIFAFAAYIPWMFSPAYSGGAELSMPGFANIFSLALIYEQAGNVTNWLLIPFIIALIIIVLLAIRFRAKIHLLNSVATVPIVLLIILSLPPLKSIFAPYHAIYSMVALPILAGVTMSLYTRELFTKKRKKAKKILMRYPAIKVAVLAICLIGVPIMGIMSVYGKGNYDFNTNKKVSANALFDDIVTLDRHENSSIVAIQQDVYYELSMYQSYHHDVHYYSQLNLDKFLEKREAIWLVGVAPQKGTFDFEHDGWRITTIANMNYDDLGETYQILKIEKE